ncbi:Exo-beta-D-glucosaminidase [Penicillium diatomitis]|uniref:Exo-beta-D-glucosaminidase n=1 Tax=Penicillium diatomitis TaxID=2819901 RepID=A0A9X0BJC4_9EURO|nr:Exo-beta-D-glucosaminidase [Penicillium diatomitis]KAJ5469253.1 Exo-beta-D-glucosaminidase [Penicillium diatomitis]
MKFIQALNALLVGLTKAKAASHSSNSLVSAAGDIAIIPGWNLRSSLYVSTNSSHLSQPGVDASDWHRVGPRGTVLAGLIESGVYSDEQLFFVDNLNSLATNLSFRCPWIYREEFAMTPDQDQYFTLYTHGITSKADLYLNGAMIVGSDEQQGSYGGRQYNVTGSIRHGTNCLLIEAYQTDYLRDFAMGFVDWNPYPPDNGTGVWRNVEIKQSGPVSMSPFRVVTELKSLADTKKVQLTLFTDLVNQSQRKIQVTVKGTIISPLGSTASPVARSIHLGPEERKTISIPATIENAAIWWPARWGDQRLYTVQGKVIIEDSKKTVSDRSRPQQFGIRKVFSRVNEHNDTAFFVNDRPFQVMGGGYGPDMFLRFEKTRILKIFEYMLDIGLNTLRLEGKQEHPELYELADQMGIMILAGWECCDKWEGWEYNDDANGVKWMESDYPIAQAAMLHEAEMMQTHPSMLGFLIGSDYWPNDQATQIYLEALRQMNWDNPVIASASQRDYPEALGPSGMKMDGPYDWVPPNYWYGDREGAAFGFGSELGAGVGTPELSSLKRFLSNEELEILWRQPKATQFHMSRYDSQFYDRSIYNSALFARYGEPVDLEDYLLKCQMADYEATRAQFEAYSAKQNASRSATGSIYWMLNSAWPNLHWQLFDYYLIPMGAYFGAKVGNRMEHVAYDHEKETVWLINHSLESKGERQLMIDLIDINGTDISSIVFKTETSPSSSKGVGRPGGIDQIQDLAFLRLTLRDTNTSQDLSRNVYWLTSQSDVLDWDNSAWYTTLVTKYSNFQPLQSVPNAIVKATAHKAKVKGPHGHANVDIQLENVSDRPAVFLRLTVINSSDQTAIAPVFWSDNYVTLWPKESVSVSVLFEGDLDGAVFELSGRNVQKAQFTCLGGSN